MSRIGDGRRDGTSGEEKKSDGGRRKRLRSEDSLIDLETEEYDEFLESDLAKMASQKEFGNGDSGKESGKEASRQKTEDEIEELAETEAIKEEPVRREEIKEGAQIADLEMPLDLEEEEQISVEEEKEVGTATGTEEGEEYRND